MSSTISVVWVMLGVLVALDAFWLWRAERWLAELDLRVANLEKDEVAHAPARPKWVGGVPAEYVFGKPGGRK